MKNYYIIYVPLQRREGEIPGNYSGLLSLAPPEDSAGECDSVAKRRHSQDRGKPCPCYTTARQARPSYSRGTPCGYPGTLFQVSTDIALPNSKAQTAGCRATTQLRRLTLSGASISKKRHESATSIAMKASGARNASLYSRNGRVIMLRPLAEPLRTRYACRGGGGAH